MVTIKLQIGDTNDIRRLTVAKDAAYPEVVAAVRRVAHGAWYEDNLATQEHNHEGDCWVECAAMMQPPPIFLTRAAGEQHVTEDVWYKASTQSIADGKPIKVKVNFLSNEASTAPEPTASSAPEPTAVSINEAETTTTKNADSVKEDEIVSSTPMSAFVLVDAATVHTEEEGDVTEEEEDEEGHDALDKEEEEVEEDEAILDPEEQEAFASLLSMFPELEENEEEHEHEHEHDDKDEHSALDNEEQEAFASLLSMFPGLEKEDTSMPVTPTEHAAEDAAAAAATSATADAGAGADAATSEAAPAVEEEEEEEEDAYACMYRRKKKTPAFTTEQLQAMMQARDEMKKKKAPSSTADHAAAPSPSPAPAPVQLSSTRTVQHVATTATAATAAAPASALPIPLPPSTTSTSTEVCDSCQAAATGNERRKCYGCYFVGCTNCVADATCNVCDSEATAWGLYDQAAQQISEMASREAGAVRESLRALHAAAVWWKQRVEAGDDEFEWKGEVQDSSDIMSDCGESVHAEATWFRQQAADIAAGTQTFGWTCPTQLPPPPTTPSPSPSPAPAPAPVPPTTTTTTTTSNPMLDTVADNLLSLMIKRFGTLDERKPTTIADKLTAATRSVNMLASALSHVVGGADASTMTAVGHSPLRSHLAESVQVYAELVQSCLLDHVTEDEGAAVSDVLERRRLNKEVEALVSGVASSAA